MIPASYPIRQRNRRLARGLQQALAALALLVLAGAGVRAGLVVLALALLVCALAFALGCSRSLRLARRSSIGARSGYRVRTELTKLESEGWHVRHSLEWRGGGDIDHLALAPGGDRLTFAIETKTRAYAPRDLARIAQIAYWQSQHERRWCARKVVAVVCLAGAAGVERWEGGVAVVSADRLVSVLRRLAGTTPKPRFLR